MRRWWRDVPDWLKIVTGLSITAVSVGILLLLISGAVILIREWV